ncbi:hypothetical protein ACL02U_25500 [Streptomyces sp. MS06]
MTISVEMPLDGVDGAIGHNRCDPSAFHPVRANARVQVWKAGHQ